MSTPLAVLHIEDSPDDHELVMRAVRKGGFDVQTTRCQTADEMRQALAAQPWDIVLCDHKLPHLDSLGALAILQEGDFDLPFIIVSGSIAASVAVDVMRHGADDFLFKDDLTRLVPAMQRELGEAEGRRARRRADERNLRQLDQLAALHTVNTAIAGSVDLGLTLKIALAHVVAQLKADAADVLLLEPNTQTLGYAAGHGFRTSAIEHSNLRLGEGNAGQAALDRQTIQIPDLSADPKGFLRADLLPWEGFASYSCVPLIAKGKVTGVLEVFFRTPHEAGPEWLEFLETMAGQVAIAVNNAQLFDGLERSNLELSLAYDATIAGWSHALDLRDEEPEGHTQRAAEMTVDLGRRLGLADNELVQIRRGALLHDIGRMSVPDSILLKPGPLSDAEWVVMKEHPRAAFDLLSGIQHLHAALDIPYSHHEKWDGSGYPRGLKGEQIPQSARIFAVVDVWDALTSDRPYRKAWTREKALEHIREQTGKHFDPKVVQAFLQEISQTEPA